jgi:hypothetical protein
MPAKKSWLFMVFLTGLLLGQLALASGSPLWAQYVPGPKLTIINNSGYPDNQVYLVFIARPYSEANSHNTHHLVWQRDEFMPAFPIMDQNYDNTVTIPGANSNPYADYSTTLDKLQRDPTTGRHFFYLPSKENDSVPNDKAGFDSGRLWISFKTPCYFHVFWDTKNNWLTYTQPTFANPTDANYNTVYDFFEPQLAVSTDAVPRYTVHADTTNVDSVAMPLLYQLYNNGTLVGGKTKGLNKSLGTLRAAFLADPVFKTLVTPTCIMAPGHGIELGKLSSTYFDNYRDYCWQYWQDNLLAFVYYSTWWSGTVDSVTQKLALTGWYNGATETHLIDKPPSKDIFLCNGVFTGTGDATAPKPTWFDRDAGLKNQIVSALNRTVMHLPPYPSLSQIGEYPWQAYAPPTGSGGYMFYKQNGLSSGNYQTNVYSKILHQLSYDGTIYGFAYDDNANQSSYIDGIATDIVLTISNCRGTTAPFLNLLLD